MSSTEVKITFACAKGEDRSVQAEDLTNNSRVFAGGYLWFVETYARNPEEGARYLHEHYAQTHFIIFSGALEFFWTAKLNQFKELLDRAGLQYEITEYLTWFYASMEKASK
jgi:hypothetical protein